MPDEIPTKIEPVDITYCGLLSTEDASNLWPDFAPGTGWIIQLDHPVTPQDIKALLEAAPHTKVEPTPGLAETDPHPELAPLHSFEVDTVVDQPNQVVLYVR
jgi:hypothetical protein